MKKNTDTPPKKALFVLLFNPCCGNMAETMTNVLILFFTCSNNMLTRKKTFSDKT